MDRGVFESDFAFPAEPVSPQVFVEDVIPSLFVDLELSPAEREIELRIGIVLRGESGGEWTLHFVDGELGIRSPRTPECDLTLIQQVDDWRSALWKGRPALVSDALRQRMRPRASGSAAGRQQQEGGIGARTDPNAVAELRALRGLLEIRVETEGVAGSVGAPDWTLAIQLGPGPLAPSPDATIVLGAREAEAIRGGQLHPIEALMTGQLRLEGDLGLILGVQALAMRAMQSR